MVNLPAHLELSTVAALEMALNLGRQTLSIQFLSFVQPLFSKTAAGWKRDYARHRKSRRFLSLGIKPEDSRHLA